MLQRMIPWFLLLTIYFIGTFLVNIFHLPLPGSIIGMILLFVFLSSGIIKLRWIENVTSLHLRHMTFLFLPFIVSIFLSLDVFSIQGWKLIFVLMVTSLMVLLGTAFSVQGYEWIKGRRLKGNDD